MGKSLVIVESPAKAKTINKILGSDFIVKSSMGHIRDLPVKVLGVDVEKGFAPQYEVLKGRKKVVDELVAAAQECDAIYLAPDPDREGEAIAWHLEELLGAKRANKNKPFYRVTYHEITPRAVREAFAHPSEINKSRVDAQQARRVVDRLVGYKVSPLLWRRVRRGLSAGRVQSVALRLVCEREQEIQAFQPEAYWVFGAEVRKLVAPTDPFAVKLVKIDGEKAEIRSAADARRVEQELQGCRMKVAEIKTRMVNRKPYPPFITSTLQQAASTFCRFSPKQTMSVAQKLYEGVNLGEGPIGLITYMRTDSVALSDDAVSACRQYVTDTYGKEYVPEKPNRYRSRGSAQEAHEAIRPTDVRLTPAKMKKVLDPAGLKLYRLIWERFVACQMVPAKVQQRTIHAEAPLGEDRPRAYLFSATVSETQFDGYRRVLSDQDKKSEDQIDFLPVVTEGEPLECLSLQGEEKETQPPSRFSEASLVKMLEANGVGRPSTYAQILSTLQQRNYVESKNRTLYPSELGMQTNGFLSSELDALFDVQFTADMEAKLDKVEEGDEDWVAMLDAFYKQFETWLEGAKEPPADENTVRLVLQALEGVTNWPPPIKRGKRTYSDETFVASVRKQLEDGEKPISLRQLSVLGKIAARHREEVPAIKDALREAGLAEYLEAPLPQPPRESSAAKLKLMKELDLDDSARSFSDSLREQVEAERQLSPAQLAALDKMVLSHAAQIPDFEARKESLGLAGKSAPEEDKESGELLELMGQVQEWAEPVKRGKREFNDESFYASLARQYEQRKYLSDRQRAALKRLAGRYHAQIPGFADVAERLGLKAYDPKPAAKKGDTTSSRGGAKRPRKKPAKRRAKPGASKKAATGTRKAED